MSNQTEKRSHSHEHDHSHAVQGQSSVGSDRGDIPSWAQSQPKWAGFGSGFFPGRRRHPYRLAGIGRFDGDLYLANHHRPVERQHGPVRGYSS